MVHRSPFDLPAALGVFLALASVGNVEFPTLPLLDLTPPSESRQAQPPCPPRRAGPSPEVLFPSSVTSTGNPLSRVCLTRFVAPPGFLTPLTLSFSQLLLAPFGTRTLMGFHPSELSPPKKPSPLSGTSALPPLAHRPLDQLASASGLCSSWKSVASRQVVSLPQRPLLPWASFPL